MKGNETDVVGKMSESYNVALVNFTENNDSNYKTTPSKENSVIVDVCKSDSAVPSSELVSKLKSGCVLTLDAIPRMIKEDNELKEPH